MSFGFWVLGAVTLIAALPGLWELGGLLRRLSNPERLATGELKHLYNTADLLVLASVTGVITSSGPPTVAAASEYVPMLVPASDTPR